MSITDLPLESTRPWSVFDRVLGPYIIHGRPHTLNDVRLYFPSILCKAFLTRHNFTWEVATVTSNFHFDYWMIGMNVLKRAT